MKFLKIQASKTNELFSFFYIATKFSLFFFFFFYFLFNKLPAQSFNRLVLEQANNFNCGNYKLGGTGMPCDVFYNDTLFLACDDSGSFCSSFTFYCVYKTITQNKIYEFPTFNNLQEFQKEWYGSTKESKETQCLYALKKIGCGNRINFESAVAGDFVQFWRNNKTGHSVIFLNWIKDERGKIKGLRYRSSQKLTNGIGEREEFFGLEKKEINVKRTYIVRLKSKK